MRLRWVLTCPLTVPPLSYDGRHCWMAALISAVQLLKPRQCSAAPHTNARVIAMWWNNQGPEITTIQIRWRKQRRTRRREIWIVLWSVHRPHFWIHTTTKKRFRSNRQKVYLKRTPPVLYCMAVLILKQSSAKLCVCIIYNTSILTCLHGRFVSNSIKKSKVQLHGSIFNTGQC